MHIEIPYKLVKGIVKSALGFTHNNGYDCIDLFWKITKPDPKMPLRFKDLKPFIHMTPDPETRAWLERVQNMTLNRGNITIFMGPDDFADESFGGGGWCRVYHKPLFP